MFFFEKFQERNKSYIERLDCTKEHFNYKLQKTLDNDIIDEYFNFLLEKDFIFLTNNPKYFPKLDLSFHYPFEISNAIIELSSDDNIFDILVNLNDINCKYIEIRIPNNLFLSTTKNILEYIKCNK